MSPGSAHSVRRLRTQHRRSVRIATEVVSETSTVRRVVVYGSSGSGKSSFAVELAHLYQVAHVEIDLLACDSQGIHVPQELLRQRFAQAIAADGWVVEGMHRDQLYRALDAADTFVWLDYPRSVVARRLARRLLRQLVLRHKRHGRTTTVRSAVQRDLPFIRKTLSNHHRRREHGEELAATATALGLQVRKLSSPGETRRFVRACNGERSGA